MSERVGKVVRVKGLCPRPQGQGQAKQIILYFIYIMKNQQKHHWSMKYKRSIDCSKPKGFSQRQHCNYGRTKTGRIINKRRGGNKTLKKRK